MSSILKACIFLWCIALGQTNPTTESHPKRAYNRGSLGHSLATNLTSFKLKSPHPGSLLNIIGHMTASDNETYDSNFEEIAVPLYQDFLNEAVRGHSISYYESVIKQIPREKLYRLSFGSKIHGPLCNTLFHSEQKNTFRILYTISKRLNHRINPTYTCHVLPINQAFMAYQVFFRVFPGYAKLAFKWLKNSMKPQNEESIALARAIIKENLLNGGAINFELKRDAIMKYNPSLLRYTVFQGNGGQTALSTILYATSHGYEAIDNTFIKDNQECDIASYRTKSTTPHYMAIQGQYGLLKHFFSLKDCVKTVDSTDINYDTPLMLVLKHASAYLNRSMEYLDTLYYTIIKVIQELLSNGASLTRKNKDGLSALTLLVNSGDIVLMEYFLRHAQLTEENVLTMLRHALATANQDIISFLLVSSEDKNNLSLKLKSQLIPYGDLLIHKRSISAIMEDDYINLITFLLNQYVVKPAKNSIEAFLKSLLSSPQEEMIPSTYEASIALAQYLKKNDIKQSIWLKYYTRHHAIILPDRKFFTESLSIITIRRRRVLLHLWNDEKLDASLLSDKGSMNYEENEKEQNKDVRFGLRQGTLKAYANNGYDINAPLRNGITPVQMAVLLNGPALLRLFIDYGAMCNISIEENTPLHVAIFAKDEKTLETLLQCGVLPELYDESAFGIFETITRFLHKKFFPLIPRYIAASRASIPFHYQRFSSNLWGLIQSYKGAIAPYLTPMLEDGSILTYKQNPAFNYGLLFHTLGYMDLASFRTALEAMRKFPMDLDTMVDGSTALKYAVATYGEAGSDLYKHLIPSPLALNMSTNNELSTFQYILHAVTDWKIEEAKELINALVDKGADIHGLYSYFPHYSDLPVGVIIASYHDSGVIPMLELMAKKGLDLYALDKSGNDIILASITRGYSYACNNILIPLVQSGVYDISKTDVNGNTLLMRLIRRAESDAFLDYCIGTTAFHKRYNYDYKNKAGFDIGTLILRSPLKQRTIQKIHKYLEGLLTIPG